jgi:hypothetical protein
MRPKNPDHGDPRETPPETSHRPRYRSHDLIEPQEAFVMREFHQINPTRGSRKRSSAFGYGPVRPKRRVESNLLLPRARTHTYTQKLRNGKSAASGETRRPSRALDQNEETVVVGRRPLPLLSWSRAMRSDTSWPTCEACSARLRSAWGPITEMRRAGVKSACALVRTGQSQSAHSGCAHSRCTHSRSRRRQRAHNRRGGRCRTTDRRSGTRPSEYPP